MFALFSLCRAHCIALQVRRRPRQEPLDGLVDRPHHRGRLPALRRADEYCHRPRIAHCNRRWFHFHEGCLMSACAGSREGPARCCGARLLRTGTYLSSCCARSGLSDHASAHTRNCMRKNESPSERIDGYPRSPARGCPFRTSHTTIGFPPPAQHLRSVTCTALRVSYALRVRADVFVSLNARRAATRFCFSAGLLTLVTGRGAAAWRLPCALALRV
jgi:hypothetical protein